MLGALFRPPPLLNASVALVRYPRGVVTDLLRPNSLDIEVEHALCPLGPHLDRRDGRQVRWSWAVGRILGAGNDGLARVRGPRVREVAERNRKVDPLSCGARAEGLWEISLEHFELRASVKRCREGCFEACVRDCGADAQGQVAESAGVGKLARARGVSEAKPRGGKRRHNLHLPIPCQAVGLNGNIGAGDASHNRVVLSHPFGARIPLGKFHESQALLS
mmetsp:Transcript_46218/g.93272  ORF Transcript_46218/g.93272 Transcript_46218/m.93272 type:complete len:220 (+) Transcript_46218:136-795(+)